MNGQKYLTNTNIDSETMEEMLRKFKNHSAKVLVNDENYFIINWQNGDFLEYQVRYVLDRKRGTLSISGDFGDGIAKWYGEMEPEKLARLLNDANYFATKLTCYTDLYTRRSEDVKEDLNDLFEEMWNKNHDGQMREDWYTFADDILELDPDLLDTYPLGISHGITSFAREYDIPEDSITTLGIRLDSRVMLWALGYQMAVAQLVEKGIGITLNNLKEVV